MSLTLLALAAAGCTTMGKNECLAVDWRTIGYEDGVAGRPGNHIAQHRKACAKHGVRADLPLYQTGREQGLREYCKPANGYRLGVRGGSYGGICPTDLEADFVSSFEAGHELHTLQTRLWNTESQLNSKRKELDRVEHRIVENSATVLKEDSTGEDRAHALVDTTNLAERVGRLKAEIRALQENKIRYERDLEEYQATHSPIT